VKRYLLSETYNDQLHPPCITPRYVYKFWPRFSYNILLTLGKVRLAKWFVTMPPKQKAKIVKDVTQLVLARRTRMCNFLEYKGLYLFFRVMNR
jgi:hypothetical protein